MMENQELNPLITQASSGPKLVYVFVAVLVLAVVGTGGYLLGTKKTSAPESTMAPKTTTKYPVATTSDETANWRTFTNPVYRYSIAAPRDFTLKLCNDCNPPEVNFSLQNNSKTITIGASYAAQWSLIANMSSKPTPVKNLKVVIQGKRYDPEEYFDNDNERYIFKIDDVESNSRSSQISLSGDYKSLNDATLVSDILSTFKFFPATGATSSPQAVADETAGWGTYTDKIYGYSIKYPKGSLFQQIVCDNTFIFNISNDSGYENADSCGPRDNYFTFQLSTNNGSFTPEEYPKSSDVFSVTVKDILINNENAKEYSMSRITPGPGPDNYKEILITKDNIKYRFTYRTTKNQSVINQILSSFRFL